MEGEKVASQTRYHCTSSLPYIDCLLSDHKVNMLTQHPVILHPHDMTLKYFSYCKFNFFSFSSVAGASNMIFAS